MIASMRLDVINIMLRKVFKYKKQLKEYAGYFKDIILHTILDLLMLFGYQDTPRN